MHDLKFFHCFGQFLNLQSGKCRAESIIPYRVAGKSPEGLLSRGYNAGAIWVWINLGRFESEKAYTGMNQKIGAWERLSSRDTDLPGILFAAGIPLPQS